MKELEYSQIVRRKMKKLQERLLSEYGDAITKNVLSAIIGDADKLTLFENSGIEISKMYDVETDYWYLFTNKQYLIYRIEDKKIIIVEMFNEREDFMMKLFGQSGRTQESIDYWGE